MKMAATQEEVFYVTRYAKMNSDLTPWNFFLWGYVKDVVFIPPTAYTHSGSAGQDQSNSEGNYQMHDDKGIGSTEYRI